MAIDIMKYLKRNILHTPAHLFRARIKGLVGFEAMEEARKAMKEINKKYHGRIREVRCDDAGHAGSAIFLVTHERKNEWMGISMVFIPQTTGEKPIQLFLYPEDQENMMEVLEILRIRRNKIWERTKDDNPITSIRYKQYVKDKK